MTFGDEVLESYFMRLAASPQAYARAYWAFLQELGPQPKPQDYSLPVADAQPIRIKLAQSR